MTNVRIISKTFDIATDMFVYFKSRAFNDIYNAYINREEGNSSPQLRAARRELMSRIVHGVYDFCRRASLRCPLSLHGFHESLGVNKQSPRLHLITGSPPAFGRFIAGHVGTRASTPPRREPLSKFNNSYLRGIRARITVGWRS